MPSIISERRREANRRNALKSTGPKTEQGKARSSRNAVSHGIFAKDLLLPGEDEFAFAKLKREMILRMNPHDVVELQFVEQFIAACWRIRRAYAAETLLYAARGETLREEHQQDRLQLIDAGKISDANDPRLAELPQTIPPAAMMVQMLQDRDDPALDRLHRYERRLEYTMNRCLKQLRQLREEVQTQSSQFTEEILYEELPSEETEPSPRPSPGVPGEGEMADAQDQGGDEVELDDENAQNEATEEKDEGGRMKDEREERRVHPSAFIPHPLNFRLTIPSPRDLLPATTDNREHE